MRKLLVGLMLCAAAALPVFAETPPEQEENGTALAEFTEENLRQLQQDPGMYKTCGSYFVHFLPHGTRTLVIIFWRKNGTGKEPVRVPAEKIGFFPDSKASAMTFERTTKWGLTHLVYVPSADFTFVERCFALRPKHL